MKFAAPALVLCLTLVTTALAARDLLQSTATQKVTVVFFDDNKLEGDHRTFTADVPLTGSKCSKCTELSYIRTNSWESFIADGGSNITVYDSHGCSGKKATLPDRSKDKNGVKAGMSGEIPGTLQDSIDSFTVCL